MTDNTKNKPHRKKQTSKEAPQAAMAQPSALDGARETSEPEIKRLNYFTGQFLEAADFKDEQEYHIRMRRLGNRMIYRPGILDGGFQVTPTKDNPKSITISSGVGIDAMGRELVVITPLVQTVPNEKSKQYYVTLEYPEKEEETNPEVFVDDQNNSATGNTRLKESPIVGFMEGKTGINADTQIIIHKIALDGNGNVSTTMRDATAERRYANAHFTNLTVAQSGRGGLTVDGSVVISSGAIMPAAGNDDGSGILFPGNSGSGSGDKAWIRYYVRSSENTALEIGVANDALDDPAKADNILLMPSGGVGIGTREPKAMLDVTGGALLGYENRSGDFTSKLKSGFYRGERSAIGGLAGLDVDQFVHLIAARDNGGSPNDANYQLQIASANIIDDKIFFRKITLGDVGTWHELATRRGNTFLGDQIINGKLLIRSDLEVIGNIKWSYDHSGGKYIRIGNLQIAWGSDSLQAADAANDKNVSFPVTFTSVPIVIASLNDPGVGKTTLRGGVGADSVSNVGFVLKYKKSDLTNPTRHNINFSWIAIGNST